MLKLLNETYDNIEVAKKIKLCSNMLSAGIIMVL